MRPAQTVLCFTAGAAILSGCAAPLARQEAWRPWTRTLGEASALPAGSSVVIRVRGESAPIAGSAEALQGDMAAIVAELLARRGFQETTSVDAREVLVDYATERLDEAREQVAVASLGSAVARSSTAKLFAHTVGVSLLETSGAVAWKGEALWDEPSPDIRKSLPLALRWMFRELPLRPDSFPTVQRLAEGRGEDFVRTYARGVTFSCPGLPYPIRFKQRGRYLLQSAGVDVKSFSNEADDTVLAAVLDLLQSAESALPTGRNDFKDPTNERHWRSVVLGGKYLIGGESPPTAVLVELSWRARAYVVTEIKVASQAEWAEFERELREWEEAVAGFFDWSRTRQR